MFFLYLYERNRRRFFFILDDLLQCFPRASKKGINLFKSTYTIPLVGGDSCGAETRLVKSVEKSTSENITELQVL